MTPNRPVRPRSFALLASALAVLCGVASCGRSDPTPTAREDLAQRIADQPGANAAPDGRTSLRAADTPAERDALAVFRNRVEDYVALHKKVEDSLPKLPDQATPKQIDENQRKLGTLLAAARPNAKPGDMFDPAMQGYVKRMLGPIFAGAAGKQLKASIMDENPITTPARVNERYPDTVPLSTMPPDILLALPPLPEELEYRFIGDDLILLDGHAHIVVDFVSHALP